MLLLIYQNFIYGKLMVNKSKEIFVVINLVIGEVIYYVEVVDEFI